MSANEFSFNINNRNLSIIKENYMNLKEEESLPINPNQYPISIEDTRPIIMSWLSFLCSKLNFSDQTLFRCISIFDQYISKIPLDQTSSLSKDYLSLIAIACLSLSTKLEEINCNYVNFLNEKVLNSPNSKVYTNKDLTQMELKILKVLKFKTIYSTPLDLIEIYIEIFKNVLCSNGFVINPNIIFQIKNYSINSVKNIINSKMYLTCNASQLAYLCFIRVLNQTNLLNLINMKQFEKNFYSFNYQLSNVF